MKRHWGAAWFWIVTAEALFNSYGPRSGKAESTTILMIAPSGPVTAEQDDRRLVALQVACASWKPCPWSTIGSGPNRVFVKMNGDDGMFIEKSGISAVISDARVITVDV